jgi:hypothetical protein
MTSEDSLGVDSEVVFFRFRRVDLESDMSNGWVETPGGWRKEKKFDLP